MIFSFALRCLIHFYKIFPGSNMHKCRHFPSCSVYALDALRQLPLGKALYRIICRVTSCHPWSKRPQVDFIQKEVSSS